MLGVDGHPGISEHRSMLPEHSDQSMGPSVRTTSQKEPDSISGYGSSRPERV